MTDDVRESVIKNLVADAQAVAVEERQKGRSIMMLELNGTGDPRRRSHPIYEAPPAIEAVEAKGWRLETMTQVEVASPYVKIVCLFRRI